MKSISEAQKKKRKKIRVVSSNPSIACSAFRLWRPRCPQRSVLALIPTNLQNTIIAFPELVLLKHHASWLFFSSFMQVPRLMEEQNNKGRKGSTKWGEHGTSWREERGWGFFGVEKAHGDRGKIAWGGGGQQTWRHQNLVFKFALLVGLRFWVSVTSLIKGSKFRLFFHPNMLAMLLSFIAPHLL